MMKLRLDSFLQQLIHHISKYVSGAPEARTKQPVLVRHNEPVRRRVTRLFAAALLASVAASPTHAGVNRWTLSLQSATPRSAVAIDPTNSAIAYVATGAGIFKTVDRGEQWTFIEAFPNASAIAIDPRNGATIVAGNTEVYSFRSELRLSEDAGATWRVVHSFEWENSVRALTFDKFESATVYAALTLSGIGKSADGGKTWTISDYRNGLLCCLLDYYTTLDVAAGGATSSTVYAASDSFFSSTDAAESWQRIDLPQPVGANETTEQLEAWTVSIDPTDPARLYVTGPYQPNNGPGAVTSGDGGQHWQRLPVPTMERITIDPRVPTTLYAPVTDTWSPGFDRPARGVMRSIDRGETWTEFNAGLPTLNVTSVTIDPTGSLLYASTDRGVFVYEVQVEPRRRGIRR